MNQSNIANGANTASNTFNNCVFRLQSALPAGNSGANNLFLTDPQFVNYAFNNLYSGSYDFHLQPTSPLIAAASDTTDIGVYGSPTRFSPSGEVLYNPIIRSLFIQNTNIAPNGILNVDVNATIPKDY